MNDDADMGNVLWCRTQPRGVGWETHKFSIVDAIEDGSRIIHKELLEKEYLIVGSNWMDIFLIMPNFKKAEKMGDGHPDYEGSRFMGELECVVTGRFGSVMSGVPIKRKVFYTKELAPAEAYLHSGTGQKIFLKMLD